jgi:hypothetical protein
MNRRSNRVSKPTKKVLENKEQNEVKKQQASKKAPVKKPQVKKPEVKKQQKKEQLEKRIAKQRELIEHNLQDEADNEVQIIRDDKDKIYKDLHYIDDDINKEIKKLINGFPETFLPTLFKGLVPLYVPKKDTPIKTKVLLSKLQDGKYQTQRSKSDKNISSTIKTVLKNFPHFKDYKEDDLTYLIKNHRYYLLDTLKYAFDKKLSIATIKNYINALLRIMYISFTNPRNQGIYIKYATLAKSLGEKQEAIDDDNTLNENEEGRYLDWNIILNRRQELETTFNNIKNKQTKEAYNINLDLILLSLYTLQPPLRQENFLLEFRLPKDTPDKKADYVYLKKDKVILNFNLNKKRHQDIDLEVNDKLAKILRQSYELYPRKYLFTDSRKYPEFNNKLTSSSVANRLRRIFIKYNVNIGASILRASYISYIFQQNPNISMTEIKKIANKMRTSHTYLLTSYKKIISTPAIVVNEPSNQEIAIKQEPNDDNVIGADNIDRVQKQIVIKEDPYIKNNERLKHKYKTDEEYKAKVNKQQKEYKEKKGKFEIQKGKILSMLRNSPEYRKRITQKTLDKYEIDLEKINFK